MCQASNLVSKDKPTVTYQQYLLHNCILQIYTDIQYQFINGQFNMTVLIYLLTSFQEGHQKFYLH